MPVTSKRVSILSEMESSWNLVNKCVSFKTAISCVVCSLILNNTITEKNKEDHYQSAQSDPVKGGTLYCSVL